MKPEIILQSDLLDIVFMNRNKEYGAYTLRKGYNQTINKAFFVTCSIVLLFAASMYINNRFFSTHILKPIFTEVVHLSGYTTEHENKIQKPKAQQKKLQAAAQHTTPVIVPDNKAQPIAPIEELDNKQIGTANVAGVGNTGNDTTANTSSSENGGIKNVEEKRQEPEIEKPFDRVETMPEFPGGVEGLKRYLLRNLREPEGLQPGEKVVVLIRFVVDKDGSIDEAIIVQSDGYFDQEVLRVVKKMPRWKPGIQNNRFVAVYYSLPVTFVGFED